MTKQPISRRAAALMVAALAALVLVTRVPTTGATTATGTFASYVPAITATSLNPSARGAAAFAVSPSLGTGGTSYGRYTRIGNLVIASFAVTFGSGANPGLGAYRISLPVPVANSLRVNGAAIGYGHEHDVNHGYLGLGPGSYRDVIYHVNTNVDSRHAGLVIGENPRAPFPSYSATNHVDSRSLDEDTAAPTDVAHVLDTLATLDLPATYGNIETDQTTNDAPWIWTHGDQIIGTLVYEAGT